MTRFVFQSGAFFFFFVLVSPETTTVRAVAAVTKIYRAVRSNKIHQNVVTLICQLTGRRYPTSFSVYDKKDFIMLKRTRSASKQNMDDEAALLQQSVACSPLE